MQQLDFLPSPAPINPHLAGLVRQFHRAVEQQRRYDKQLAAGLERVARDPHGDLQGDIDMTKSTGRGPGSILVVPKFGMARHKQVLKTSWEQSAIRTSLARLA